MTEETPSVIDDTVNRQETSSFRWHRYEGPWGVAMYLEQRIVYTTVRNHVPIHVRETWETIPCITESTAFPPQIPRKGSTT